MLIRDGDRQADSQADRLFNSYTHTHTHTHTYISMGDEVLTQSPPHAGTDRIMNQKGEVHHGNVDCC